MLQLEGLAVSGDANSGGQRRSLSLWDHMSAVENTNRDPLAGLTLDAVLTSDKRITSAMTPSPTPPAQVSRTLLDIIRDEEPHGSLFGHKDKKSWKAFRDRLRLRRAGAAWTSSVPIPASDIPIQNSNSGNPNNVRFNNSRSLMSRRNSVRFTTVSSVPTSSEEDSNADSSASVATSRPIMTRRTSTRYAPAPPPAPDSPQSEESDIPAVEELPPPRSFRPQMSRHNSTRVPATNFEVSECEEEPEAHEGTRRLATVLAEERAMSAREAVAAQEAAEAEAAAQAAAEAAAEAEEGEEAEEEGAAEAQPVRMSLMDLLEETDRQMGFTGMTYNMGGEEEYEEEEEEEEEEDGGGGSGGGRVEHTCCVCMVRHKGAAFIPCGHTFCRLCSRELWVQRGNCPLCNGFIVEILDIF